MWGKMIVFLQIISAIFFSWLNQEAHMETLQLQYKLIQQNSEWNSSLFRAFQTLSQD